MTAKRFRISKVFELNKPFPIYDGDCPLTQKEVSDLLNELHEENEHLESHLNMVREVRDDVIKENEQLKQFIQELTTKGTGKIHLANGSIYKADAILIDIKR